MQPRDELFELRLRARLRQREAMDVIFDVHVVVFDPDRIGQLKRHLRELAMKQAAQVQALR
ncbi:hypothetical protein QCE47_18735 [Caballeronia sp. LZ025]|nr:hypothetical protein [Caballeronia sp. LZ025]MDR5734345.1 hypothetical protein [Caballeronia sp. LZ025]